MKVNHPQQPRIGQLVAKSAALTKQANLRNLELNDVDWSNQEASLVKLDEISATSLKLSSAKLSKFEISDCRFKNCQLTGTKLIDSNWLRVEVIGSRCSGLDLAGAHLSDAIFKDCKLDLANFRWAEFKRVKFQDCELREADFGGAKFYDVSFTNCNIEQVDFSQAKLTNVDLQTSALIDLKGVLSLKGAMLSRDQLIQISGALAAEAGIIIDHN